jgi:hypothetical protein
MIPRKDPPGFRLSSGTYRSILLFLLWTLRISAAASAQIQFPAGTGDSDNFHIDELHFRSQPIRDIILAMAKYAGLSLLPDETVSGSAEYYFADIPFDQALDRIISDQKLYVREYAGVTLLSRIMVEKDANGIIRIDAEELSPRTIINALSRISETPLRWGQLPETPTSFHGVAGNITSAVRALLAPWPEYEVEDNDGYILISRREDPGFSSQRIRISLRQGRVSLEASGLSAAAILEALFRDCGMAYCNYAGDSGTRPEIAVEDVGIGELIALLTAAGDLEYRLLGNVHIIWRPSADLDIPGEAEDFRYEARHVAPDRLIASLPSGSSRQGIRISADGRAIVIRREPDAARQLLSYFAAEDRPTREIEYHLLIIQLQENARSRFSAGVSMEMMDAGSGSGISGDLREALGMNFDVLSNFGYAFAADLSWDLSRSRADIVADTVLRGREAQEVVLDNTSTYRYREGDPDEPSVIREITTGLVIRISGAPSSDGLIEVAMTVDLSKRGVDTSGLGNPPPTSSRRFSSIIRIRPSEVTQVADLVLEERSSSSQGLSLTGSQDRTRETSRLRIYLLPYVIYGNEDDLPPLPDREQMFMELVHGS